MKIHSPLQYCGRSFSENELETIRKIIAEDPNRTRAHISRLVCKHLGWYKPDGDLKQMSCRVALLRMQDDGLLSLPAPRHIQSKCKPQIQFSSATDPKVPIRDPVDALGIIHLQIVTDKFESSLWREYIHRYHYLGYQPLPGAQLRYFAKLTDGTPLALLGFGAAAWKTDPRDRFVGWSHEQRKKKLHLIVNNARYLIMPWIKSKNLASKLLAMTAKRITIDWKSRYGYTPVLLETFVDSQRFRGTCYKAANWIYVGQTKGRGKLDVHNTARLPIKDVWLYPLVPPFRKFLSSAPMPSN